jgi:2-polyprenyl-6-methoxyphenol hydroxylase-like FAD-dependent oxidoreductase
LRRYARSGWRSAELAREFAKADDVYFDAVSGITMPRWTEGRITLLGDAASCVSLFGDGSSLAMVGAETLADALIRSASDAPAALIAYECSHRTRVMPRLQRMGRAGHFMVPRTALGLMLRNVALRGLRVVGPMALSRRTGMDALESDDFRANRAAIRSKIIAL